jgi:ribosomal protein S18 acetylase RimI-like enzyme
MEGVMSAVIRAFEPPDHAAARALWSATEGVALGPGDAEAELHAFLRRNPGLSFVAADAEEVVATVLCGHDGRRGYLYHLAVRPSHRRQGLGRALVLACFAALEEAGIRRAQVSVFADNAAARAFWERLGGRLRSDLAVFTLPLRGDDVRFAPGGGS